MDLYPLVFEPIFKYRIWGGNKLRTTLHKECSEDQIGESWEISDVKGSKTVVAHGHLKGKTLTDLIAIYGPKLLGHSVMSRFGDQFPLLVKCIDAKTPLSIQVHPTNEVAKKRHNGVGKNEMWYIMQADPFAEIVIGFNHNTDKQSFNNQLKRGTIENSLHKEKVSAGDLFYIPAGRVHAIGAGVLLAEIQQTSNITYRIYDYDRVDKKTGKKRELHNELAEDVIDYTSKESYKTSYTLEENKRTDAIHTPFFTTNIISLTSEVELDYSDTDSFVILMCVEGSVNVIYNKSIFHLATGYAILLPAMLTSVTVESSNAKLLEVTI
ncbi:type I phosphomannose isomerase catalytic subunit [Dokdonia sp. Hel_I_53]|uniref:type I phosphomannose isomerase catalytic subunit n=1 Tax=Dokdonia sp. Hel_I_53 TaxID=1566287 RepID=UPI00119AA4A9|nr:type I phosphomannose isomerase catalytic subunit [Dokdonia sp. Hel_I_53]TVZ52283.1 mannose-6-phosphate isomerase, type 1 [Dokdonia sp. Hel_I_53]